MKQNSGNTAFSFLKLRHKAEESASDLPGLMMQAERAAKSVLSGDHLQRKTGSGERFWQFREYDTSDRPQDIDWRQSAKGDHVYVRQKEHQNAQTIALWCAKTPGMDFTSGPSLPTKADIAKIMTLGLGILFTRLHEKVAPLDGSFQPGRTEKTIQLLGQALISEEQEGISDIHFVSLPRNSSVVMIGDFLDPVEKIEETCTALAAQSKGGCLIQVLDPAELDLPYQGRAVFQNPGSSEREIIDNVESIRIRYKERIDAHINALKKICHETGWHYVLHKTDTDIRQTMFDIWMEMMPEKIRSH